jgi:hypothetical protein
MAATQEHAVRVYHPAAEPMLVPAHEVAQYIEAMCSELGQLADHGGLGFLAYLLEVAREEARIHCEPRARGIVELHGELPPR